MNSFHFASALALIVCATGCAATSASSSESGAQGITETSAVVQEVDTPSGKAFANAAGLSLYTFDRDTTIASTCYNACANAWPALLVASADAVAAPFGVTTRTDGTTQVMLDGHPLYLYAGDGAPGDVNGDGIGGVWHLARPSAKPAVQTVTTAAGDVFASSDGRSLYTFDRDTTAASTCYNACANAWPALLVASADAVAAPFGVTPRTDGTTQITLDGHPLYLYAGDGARGDVNGDGIGGVWHLARPASR